MNGLKNEKSETGARRRGIYLLPNLLTTGGLFAGFYSMGYPRGLTKTDVFLNLGAAMPDPTIVTAAVPGAATVINARVEYQKIADTHPADIAIAAGAGETARALVDAIESMTTPSQRERLGEWVDRHSGTFFIAPAVVLILVFAIFPTIYSIFFALSRVRFTADGLKFRYVGFRNFSKQFFGSSEIHFLGRTDSISIFGTIVFVAIVVAVLWWLIRSRKITTWVGMIGRTISAAMAIFLSWILCASLLSGNSIGTLARSRTLSRKLNDWSN